MKSRRWSLGAVCILLVIAVALAACSATIRLLKEMKARGDQQDYAWMASQEVSCEPSDEGCNQLHLLKGDACFRLAKQDIDARRHYECAATHLQEGIRQTQTWRLDNLDLNRAQTYENLGETLRQWQDMEQGAQADRLTQRLVETAGEFLRAEPGNVAGIYFLASARFTTLRSALLHPERSPTVCQDLAAILQLLEGALPRARGTRYEDNYLRLQRDIEGAKRTIPRCA